MTWLGELLRGRDLRVGDWLSPWDGCFRWRYTPSGLRRMGLSRCLFLA